MIICVILIMFFQSLLNFEKSTTEIPLSVDYIPASEVLLYKTSKSITLKRVEGQIIRKLPLNINQFERVNNSVAVAIDSIFYFINNTGGFVYRWHNEMSSIFTYGKKIYRYGGYGFFDARNFFTFFDIESNEWEVEIIDEQILPLGSYDSKFFVDENYFYKIGGKTTDPFDRTKSSPLKDVWRFNLIDNTWEHLLDFDYFETLTFSKNDFVMNNKFYFINQNQLYAFNLENNTFEQISNFPLIEKLVKNYPIFSKDTNLFYFTSSSNEEKQISVNKYSTVGNFRVERQINTRNNTSSIIWIVGFLTVSLMTFNFISILNKKTKKEKNIIFVTKNSINRGGFLTVSLMTFNFISILNKKIKKEKNIIFVTKNSINRGKKKIEIDDIEQQILQFFHKSNPISITQIISLLDSKEITYSQKLRLKDKIISDLNTKIKILLESEINPIKKQKDSKDSRIRVYKLFVQLVY